MNRGSGVLIGLLVGLASAYVGIGFGGIVAIGLMLVLGFALAISGFRQHEAAARAIGSGIVVGVGLVLVIGMVSTTLSCMPDVATCTGNNVAGVVGWTVLSVAVVVTGLVVGFIPAGRRP